MARCNICGDRTTATAGNCQSCKSKIHHAFKKLRAAGSTVEWVGGAWWAFDKRGATLACRDGKFQCVLAAAAGGPVFEGGDEEGAQV